MAIYSIIFGTFLWSIDTLIRYPLASQLNASTIVFVEHLFLVLYFIPLLYINQFSFKKINLSAINSFAFIGIVGSAASTLAFTHAFALLNPSLVVLLQKLQPIVTITLSAYLLKEKIKASFIPYAFLAIMGGLLISYPDFAPVLNDLKSAEGPLLGYLLTLFAVVGWGASTVFGKKLTLQNFNESELMAGRFIFGFLFLFFYCLMAKTLPPNDMNYESYLKILFMVLLSGLLGMYFYYRGLKKLPAHLAAIAELFFPLSAVTVNWIYLNQSLKPMQIAGAVLLLASTYFLQKSQMQKTK